MPEEMPEKKQRVGNACGRCRFCIVLTDPSGRCRRYPPTSPSLAPDSPGLYPLIDMDSIGCGEWDAPRGS